jgi:hypothetical protein
MAGAAAGQSTRRATRDEFAPPSADSPSGAILVDHDGEAQAAAHRLARPALCAGVSHRKRHLGLVSGLVERAQVESVVAPAKGFGCWAKVVKASGFDWSRAVGAVRSATAWIKLMPLSIVSLHVQLATLAAAVSWLLKPVHSPSLRGAFCHASLLAALSAQEVAHVG